MTKNQIIDRIANKLGPYTTKRAVREIIDAYLDQIAVALSKGEKVLISGHGTYKVTYVEDKPVVIPGTKTRKIVKGHRAARFSPGKALKRAVK